MHVFWLWQSIGQDQQDLNHGDLMMISDLILRPMDENMHWLANFRAYSNKKTSPTKMCSATNTLQCIFWRNLKKAVDGETAGVRVNGTLINNKEEHFQIWMTGFVKCSGRQGLSLCNKKNKFMIIS